MPEKTPEFNISNTEQVNKSDDIEMNSDNQTINSSIFKPRLVIENKDNKNLEDIQKDRHNFDTKETEDLKKKLDEEIDNITPKKPKYSQKPQSPELTPEERVNNFKESSYERPLKLIERIEIIKKCIPYPNGDVFINKINQIRSSIEGILKEESGLLKVAEDESMLDTLIKKPRTQFAAIERKILEDTEIKLNKFFEPLINTARSDVKRFLIKHFNTIGMSPDKAQEIILEKSSIERPIEFKFRTNLFNFGPKEDRLSGALGATNGISIEIFLDNISFLENEKLDEVELLDTMIHEIVHNVSSIHDDGNIGLAKANVFDFEKAEGKNTAETNLNELITQTITMEIASKYYDNDKMKYINFKKGEQQQITGYINLVASFLDLKQQYPNEINAFIKLATDTMLQGDFDALKKFLSENKVIHEELEKIIT